MADVMLDVSVAAILFYKASMKCLLLCFLPALLTACGGEKTESPAPAAISPNEQTPAAITPQPVAPPVWSYEIVATYPHGEQYFTQGLFIRNGVMYETTGKRGESALIRHDFLGNATRLETALPNNVFGEGSVSVDNRIISLTWRDGVGHIHNADTLALEDEFSLSGEGWGITYDGEKLVVSDGTDRLRFFDPNTYEEIGTLPVRIGSRVVTRLNELEYIKGEIWANVWQTDVIVRINPKTGQVNSFVNLAGLYADNVAPTNHVLNGIAYDEVNDRLFVTGKRWPEIFEIKLRQQN